MTFVYFLYLSNGDVYKGSTDNLEQRIKQHEIGRVESTRNYRPINLIGYESYALKSDALRREQFLKKSEGMKFFRQQYRDVLKVAGVTQRLECNLAKVEVEGSNPFSRSRF